MLCEHRTGRKLAVRHAVPEPSSTATRGPSSEEHPPRTAVTHQQKSWSHCSQHGKRGSCKRCGAAGWAPAQQQANAGRQRCFAQPEESRKPSCNHGMYHSGEGMRGVQCSVRGVRRCRHVAASHAENASAENGVLIREPTCATRNYKRNEGTHGTGRDKE